MQNPKSKPVVIRFFEALQILKQNKIIRGKATFTRRYEINRWTLNNVEKNPVSGMFQVGWLVHLVEDYNVSALWLLTGKGEVFTNKKRKNDQEVLSVPTGQTEGLAGRKASVPSPVERERVSVPGGV